MQHKNRVHTLRRPRQGAIDLRQRRRWHEDDGEGNADDTTTTTDTQPDKKGQGGSGDDGATFTQADMDRVAGERAKRAEEAALKKLFGDLEVENADSLKALLQAQRERDDAEKSDLEKAQTALEAAQQATTDAVKRADDAEQQRLTDRRDSAIKLALTNAEHPQDVLQWIQSNKADDMAALMADDGTVDDDAVKKLVTAVEKERPNFFKAASPGSPSHSGGKPPTPDNKELREQIKRSIRY